MIGQLLGHYRIESKLGEGGMGVVYRATDTKLGRHVALKVLPAGFAQDADRMARFTREAQVLASLNHPNIASIYGVEERALVMELVEGPTLADRIGAGPIPLEEALAIARQIAEGLDAAHEKGIIHRDLKPANVKITPEGIVKVLDFGLAKAVEQRPGTGDPVNSPTLVHATLAGVILGTAAYMAPEQAHGRPSDRRADVWSFGAVLFEMLSAKQAFDGESVTEVLGSVLKSEPDWEALPASTPAPIRKLLRRCLMKDRRQRLQAIGEARIGIEEYLATPEPPVAEIARPLSSRLWIGVTGLLTLSLAAALFGWWRSVQPTPQRPLMRLDVDLGTDIELASVPGGVLALAPDGTRLAVIQRSADGRSRLAMRLLAENRATPFPGTEGAADPFFSADSQWIAFFADRMLKKVSVQGGAPVTLCAAPLHRGGSWGDDGNIIVALNRLGGLSRVPSSGGPPTPATELSKENGEATHRHPQVLPGSRAVLFTAHNSGIANWDDASIEVVSVQTGQRKTVHRGGYHGRYLPSGHLVYLHQGTLFAAPFDLSRLAVTGSPAPAIEDIRSRSGISSGYFDFSQTGTFAYIGGGKQSGSAIFWLDGSGKTQPLQAAPGLYRNPRFSPDGKRLAFSMQTGQGADIWVRDLERETASRLSFLPGLSLSPVWTPDGKHIVFQSTKPASRGIYWIRADGSGEAHRLTDGEELPHSFSPDGKRLAINQPGASDGLDISIAPVEGDGDHPRLGKREPFLRTPFAEGRPQFSPDGRWLAYVSNESGGSEVYVRPFPGPGGKWQISTGGGIYPIWSGNGHELFFLNRERSIAVAGYTVKGDSFAVTRPRVWSATRLSEIGASRYDLAPDGKRFAVILDPAESEEQKPITHVTFLLNFFDELRRRVPP